MKTILFVLDYYSPHRWWVENVFENIILRLNKKWYKIIILTSRFDKKLKEYEIISKNIDNKWNIEIYRIWKNRLYFMIKAVSLWKKIFKNLNNNIDVIHASTYGWAIPASILWKMFNKKVILTVHEIFGNLWFKYKWIIWWCIYKIFESIIFKFKYNKYHCVSNNTASDLKRYYNVDSNKISVIHNWVDTDFWNNSNYNNVSKKEISALRKKYWRDNKFVFLYFGHAGKSKWIDYLIKALPEILKLENIVMVFNIINSKRTKSILRKLYSVKKTFQEKTKITILNKKGEKLQIFNWFNKIELRKLIASCDCIIAPSISEWFGSVHTEAVAMWKILITTETSAIPEVVWGNIKFIKPESSGAISNAIKDVLKWDYKKIPNKIFNWDDTVKNIEKLY